MPIHRTLNQSFFEHWTPEMAYLLGYIAADGTISIGKRGNKYLQFNSIDRELIVCTQRLLSSSHKITLYKSRRGEQIYTCYRLQIGSKRLVDKLQQIGITQKKAYRLPFPKIPKECVAHFVRGYFDGDGCISYGLYRRKNRPSNARVITTVFTSCSAKFLHELHMVLKRNGIKGGSRFFSQGAFRLLLSFNDSLCLEKFMYINTNNLFLKRKRESFIKARQKLLGR